MTRTSIGRYILPGQIAMLSAFLYSMILSFAHTRAALLLEQGASTLLFRTDLIPYAAGLVLLAYLCSKVPPRTVCIASSLIMLLFLPALFFAQNSLLFFGSVYCAMFLCGIIGGYSYCVLMRLYDELPHIGKVFGVGLSLSTAFQFFMQTVLGSAPAMLCSLIAASFLAAGTIALAPGGSTDSISSGAAGYQVDGPGTLHTVRTRLAAAVLLTVCFEYLAEFLACELVVLVSEKVFLAYDFPRLFMIPGYLMMGFFADIRRMRYIPIVTLCGAIFAVLNPVLFISENNMVLNACIFYAVVGIINSFLAFGFWKIILDVKRQDVKANEIGQLSWMSGTAAFICVAGRITDSLMNLLISDRITAAVPLPLTIFIQLSMIILCIIVMALTGQFTFLSRESAEIADRNPVDLQHFALTYGLTDREQEVFGKALYHHGTMAELAEKLYISRSVLYKHVRSVCEKTGRDSLGQVIRLYYGTGEPPVLPTDTGEPRKNASDGAAGVRIHAAPVTPAGDECGMDTAGGTTADTASDSMQTAAGLPAEDGQDMQNKDISRAPETALAEFIRMYNLTENEAAALRLFVDFPGHTQKELAEIQGVNLRTMQRYMAGIWQKTGAGTPAEILAGYHRFAEEMNSEQKLS